MVIVRTISEADNATADANVDVALLELDGIIKLDEAIEKAKRKLKNFPI